MGGLGRLGDGTCRRLGRRPRDTMRSGELGEERSPSPSAGRRVGSRAF